MFLGNQPLPPIFLKRTPNYWYTIADGNWSNPAIWSSTGRRRRSTQIPQSTDSVIIGNRVAVNQNVTIVNALIQGSLVFDSTARTFTVANSFFCQNLDMSTSNASHNLVLNGFNNWINASAFVTGTSSTITYSRSGDQQVLNLAYNNLSLISTGLLGTKFINSSLNVNNLYLQTANCESTNNIIVTGQLRLISQNGHNAFINSSISIELRNGIQMIASGLVGSFNLGPANLNFTTNNQNIGFNNGVGEPSVVINGQITIDDNLTITNQLNWQTNRLGITHNNTLNGLGANAIFDNRGLYYSNSSSQVMNTGQFICTNGSNTFVYSGTNSITIKSIVYHNLHVTNPSITFPSSQLVCNSSCKIFLNGNAANIPNGLLVRGSFDITSQTINGSVELQGGLITNNGTTLNVINGNVNFTTNNQTITANTSLTINGDISIANGLNIQLGAGNLILLGTLNGSNSSSVFDVRATFDYRNDAAIMVTGLFRCDQAANTVIYNKTGTAQVIRVPDDGNYRNLTLTGNTSTKTVGGAGTVNVRGTRLINTGVTVVGTITNNP